MQTFSTLVRLVAADSVPEDLALGRSHRFFLAVTAALGAVAMAAIWGVAVGSSSVTRATSNLVEVPMLLVVSALASLPAVALLWKLTSGAGVRASDLVVSYAVALFGGTLVLAVLSPIVALYQHSSAWAGPFVAIGSAVVAFATGAALLVRVLQRLVPSTLPRRGLAVPIIGLLVVQAAAMAQLAAMVPPVLEHRTAFGHGIDAIGARAPEQP